MNLPLWQSWRSYVFCNLNLLCVLCNLVEIVFLCIPAVKEQFDTVIWSTVIRDGLRPVSAARLPGRDDLLIMERDYTANVGNRIRWPKIISQCLLVMILQCLLVMIEASIEIITMQVTQTGRIRLMNTVVFRYFLLNPWGRTHARSSQVRNYDCIHRHIVFSANFWYSQRTCHVQCIFPNSMWARHTRCTLLICVKRTRWCCMGILWRCRYIEALPMSLKQDCVLVSFLVAV